MKVIASFVGKNKDFKAWLVAGMPQNVICLAEYWEKRKTARKRPEKKSIKNIVVPILPDGAA